MKNRYEQLHQKTKKQHINQEQKQDTVFKFGSCKRQNLGSKVKMLGINKRLRLKKSELESTDWVYTILMYWTLFFDFLNPIVRLKNSQVNWTGAIDLFVTGS